MSAMRPRGATTEDRDSSGRISATRYNCNRIGLRLLESLLHALSRLLRIHPASVAGPEFAFRDDISWTGRLRYDSDRDDSDFAARRPDEPFCVIRVACENRRLLPEGRRHHNGVNDIRGFGHA